MKKHHEKKVYKQRFCLLCQSKKLIPVLTLKSTPLGDQYVTEKFLSIHQPLYPIIVLLCKQCGHVQLQHIVCPENIYRKYIYQTVTSSGLVKHFHDYSQYILDNIKPPKKSLIIDIGSNDGILLRAFKNKGLYILGIDPAKKIAQRASSQGIPTIPKFFTSSLARSIKKKFGKATVITANNTMANVNDLDDFVEGVRSVLAPDGVFVFETSYLLDLIHNMIFDVIYHEHISYFSISPLVSYFQRHGLELIDVLHVPTKGGSIRCTVQRKGGPRKVSGSCIKFVTQEKKEHLQNKKIFQTFEKAIARTKKKLWDFLSEVIEQHRSIAGFGASTTTTTLSYHFDLARMVPYLIDENPIKIHTFSPGRHIPVLSPSVINERKPDYILILAWRFADQIVKKNRAYLKQGGHFVIPLPTFRII